jgi:hypothetical protein
MVGWGLAAARSYSHPGAKISVFEAHDGWRYQCVATDTPRGQLPFLEARHRAHARVEDRVKAIKPRVQAIRSVAVNASCSHT